jgi:predicted membrane protein
MTTALLITIIVLQIANIALKIYHHRTRNHTKVSKSDILFFSESLAHEQSKRTHG